MVNPFYFGSGSSPLYGIYHPPRSRPVARTGVVLCNPFGREYMRAHRSLVNLARELASAGRHVLRFDWHGTGDSSGVGAEGTLERWTADVGLAVEELRAMSGIRSVCLIGIRLGAVPAIRAAAERRDVDELVAWDPVADGSAHLVELEERTRRVGDGNDPPGADGTRWIEGFPVGAPLFSELDGLRPESLPAPSLRRLSVLLSGPRAGRELEWPVPGNGVADSMDVERLETGGDDWSDPSRQGAAIPGRGPVEQILSWLGAANDAGARNTLR